MNGYFGAVWYFKYKLIVNNIMAKSYKSGEKVPESGLYKFNGSLSSTSCTPTKYEKIVPLSKGERFPPISSCNSGAKWKLEKKG